MITLSTPARPERKTWTVADLYRRFGPIPFERIRHDPPPGAGTIDDVVRLNDHEDRLYELVDGILVEKTAGYEESFIAGEILLLLKIFVKRHALGLVAGEGGMLKFDDRSGADSRRFIRVMATGPGGHISPRTRSGTGPRLGRGGHQSGQHPEGDGGKAPRISNT